MTMICKEVCAMQFSHKPVLLDETMKYLALKPGEIILDGTVGGGGHSRAILERIVPGGRLIAVDQDRSALSAAKMVLSQWQEQIDFVHDNFSNIKEITRSLGVTALDGILLDIGVSSHQLDEDERGFSFHADAPLDMRMNRDGAQTAADLVNELEEDELAKIIRDYGEELWARRIAQFIVTKRKAHGRIETTGELVEIIKAAIPAKARRRGPHPARRTFQALRIAVNDELGVLAKAVLDGIDCLKPGGRLAVITFHSLEDRIVKKLFQQAAGSCQCPPGFPQCTCGWESKVKILTGKPVQAGETELAENPRSRSAKLRVAMKVLNVREGE